MAGILGAMSELYHELLDAAVEQLQQLKARGARFVNVSSETMQELAASRPVLRESNLPISKEAAHMASPVTPQGETGSAAIASANGSAVKKAAESALLPAATTVVNVGALGHQSTALQQSPTS